MLCSCAALSMLDAVRNEQSSETDISSQPIESSIPELPISSQTEPSSAPSSLSPSSELEISQPPASSQPASTTPSQPPATSSKPEPKPSGIKVDLFDGLCTVTLPESWKGRYMIEEYKADGEVSAIFYNTKNYKAGYGGMLFLITKSTEYKSKSDFEQNSPMRGMSEFLTKYSGGIIYWHWVTDVQYSNENAEDYMSMNEDSSKVIDSLVVNE